MIGSVHTDTSYYNPALSALYPYGVVCFRGFDGDWEDPLFRSNLRAAAALVKGNRLITVIVYVVYRPGLVDAQVAALKAAIVATLGSVPQWLVAMIDAESWGGAITGNQSAGLNRLYALLCAMMGGDARRTLGYANRGDFGALWPARPPRMRTVLASYGGSLPNFPGLISWQYTNGQVPVLGLPTSSPPFGAVDHNVSPGLTPATFAAALGALPGAALDPLEEIMAMYPSRAAFEAAVAKIVNDSVDAKLRWHGPRWLAALRTGKPNAALTGPAEVVDQLGLNYAISAAGASPAELAVLQQVRDAISAGFHIQINGETVSPAAPPVPAS